MRSEQRQDPDTGLLTDAAFHAVVACSIRDKQARGEAAGLAVLSIHLDRLSEIRQYNGSDTAERLIQAAAERLNGCVRARDRLAHAGSGRFRVLLDPLHAAELAASMTDKIRQVLRIPFAIHRQSLGLSASIGISRFPQDTSTAEALIHQADQCMQYALTVGDCYHFNDRGVGVALGESVELEDDPREALRADQFEVHYQPRVKLANDTVVAAEALVRWPHPVHGNIPPTDFIPVAESTGLIHELGAWVLETACSQAVAWQSGHGKSIQVSVNVSGRQFDHPEFPDLVEQTLKRTRLPPALLELEITESTIMRRPDDVTAALHRLRALGVGIALDDFGTGYSSLACLRSFPLDTLKIDRSFMQDPSMPDKNVVLLRSIIDLAHALGLRVIAEGVETSAQRHSLYGQRCDEIQGFLIAPAIPADQFEQRFLGPGMPGSPSWG